MQLTSCVLCGTEYDARRRFCPRCGEARTADGTLAGQAARTGGTRLRALAVVSALAVVVVVAAIALPKRTPPVTPGPPVLPRIDRPAPSAEAPLPTVDPEAVPPAERAFLDEVALGQIAYAEGRFEDALLEFAKALEANPRNAHAANAAGQTLVRLGRPADAIGYLERATALAPSRPDFHFNLARASGLNGRWPDAVREYRQAADLNPESYPTAFNLAQALERSGDVEAALAEYQRGAELAPLEPSFRLAVGTLAERLGRTEESRSALEAYLELVPAGGESDRVRQRLATPTAGNATTVPGAGHSPAAER